MASLCFATFSSGADARATATPELLVRDAGEVTHLGGGITATRYRPDDRPHRFSIKSPASKDQRGFLDPDEPLAAQAARKLGMWKLPVSRTVSFKLLMEKGVFRLVSETDMRKWEAAAKRNTATGPGFDSPGGFGIRGLSSRKGMLEGPDYGRKNWVVLTRPVKDAPLMTNIPRSVVVFIPENLKRTDAPQGGSAYFSLEDGTCWGRGGLCAMPDPQSVAASPACFGGAIPQDIEVHALATQAPSHLKKLDRIALGKAEYANVGQIDVYVSQTKKPLFLTLGVETSAVWAFKLAEGANVAGVLVRGNSSQAVSGLPKDVPVRFSTERDGADPHCGGYANWPGYGGKLEQWAQGVKAITGRGFDHFQSHGAATHFLIGEWPGIPKAPRSVMFSKQEWGPEGEVPALELDPLEEMRSSGGVTDSTFSLKNRTVQMAVIGLGLLTYFLLRSGVTKLWSGIRGKPKTSGRIASSFGWAYTKSMFSAGGAYFALLLTGVDTMAPNVGVMLSPFGIVIAFVLGVVSIGPATLIFRCLEGMDVQRGLRDVAAGAGTGVVLALLISSLIWSSFMVALIPVAGAAGGWSFWRARGYPGGNERVAAFLNHGVDIVSNQSPTAALNAARAFRSREAEDVMQVMKKRRPRPRG